MAAAAAAKTASTHRAAFVHGTHTADILGYRDLIKALGRLVAVTSGTFRVGGRDWNVVCGFDGRLTDVSLQLAQNNNAGPVTAMVSLSIEDPTGGRMPMKIGDEDTALTFTRYYRVDVPEAIHNYVKDDRLRIRCGVRVLEVESAPTRYCFVADPPPPDVTGFLGALLDSGQRADVTFAVGRRSCRLDAHRLVLAMRSPVFRAKFFGDSGDSSLEWFRVHDVSAPVFRAMLHFIYTDDLLVLEEDELESSTAAMDLLVAADLYGLDRLRLMCERTLWERVRTGGGVGSAISTLALVNGRDSCRELQDLCIGYVADDWAAATATEEYRELKATCPALLADVLEDVMTKQQLLLRPSSDSDSTHQHHNKSASVYRPSEVWRGTHQFTVLGHSVVLRTHANSGFISSGAFEVGGHQWRVLYYPSGYDEQHQGQVMLQLQTHLDPGVVLEASGTITVVDGSGGSELQGEDDDDDLCSQADFWHTYDNDEPLEGCSRKLDISSLVGPDDSLTLECSFEFQVVVGGANKTTMTATHARLPAKEQDMVVPPPSISWHLERLLESGVGSDVAFSVEDGGELFHAHTLVLNARAPALLSQTWAEVVKGTKKKKKHRTTICVDGIKAVVFKALLHFVYTDELPPMDDLVRAAKSMPEPASGKTTRLAADLLAAAERYHLVERMRPLCENLLCEVITPENAAATLEVARRHGRAELRAFCLDYMTSPGVFKAVVATEGYQALSPDAVREIVAHLAH